MGCAKPGVARMQAASLSPEIMYSRGQKDNRLCSNSMWPKPTLCNERKAADLLRDKASEAGHHRGLRAGHAFKGVARELGRANCLLASKAGEKGQPGEQKTRR